MELEQLAQQAIAIVKQAGELIRSIPRPHVYTKEGHANFVTEADMASQKFLIQQLSPLLPEAHFFAEEQEENTMAPGWNWVIDPIDGTSNFIRGYRPSSISVGLVKDGQPMMGLVLVGVMMTSSFKEIKWDDISEAIPAFFAGIFMALCYSISYGIAMGFITYCIVKVCKGEAKKVHPILWVVTALFILNFILLAVI